MKSLSSTKSAVDLLGSGSVDVVQTIVNAIDTVRNELEDINHFEIDVNQALNSALEIESGHWRRRS